MERSYLQTCVCLFCVMLWLPGCHVVARGLPLGGSDVTGPEKRSFQNQMKENQYLNKLTLLDPVDMCFVGCRICFKKDHVLLSCVNDLCLQQVMAGQSPANTMWSSICPPLDF